MKLLLVVCAVVACAAGQFLPYTYPYTTYNAAYSPFYYHTGFVNPDVYGYTLPKVLKEVEEPRREKRETPASTVKLPEIRPLTYTYPYNHAYTAYSGLYHQPYSYPLSHYSHVIAKRDAEERPVERTVNIDDLSPHRYTYSPYTYPYHYNYPYTHNTYAAPFIHHLKKREAKELPVEKSVAVHAANPFRYLYTPYTYNYNSYPYTRGAYAPFVHHY